MDYTNKYEKLSTRYSTLNERFETWRPKLSGICGLILRIRKPETYKRIDNVLTKTSQEIREVEKELYKIGMKDIIEYMDKRLETIVTDNETSNA